MKRAVLLSILLAILFLPKSNAQHFSFVTSFGVTQSWGMPYEVVHAIEHDYWGYDVVHTSRINQHGKLFFDVLLQRGDVFVNVSIGRYGRIYNRVITYDYPFYNHVCNNFCGYHSNFYRRNVVACGSHHHHGHNHVTYVRHNNYYSHPGNGNAYGHYKAKGNKHYDTHQNNRKDYRDTNSYKSRQNSNDYQSRSSSRYVVENSKNRGNNDAYRSSKSNSSNGGNNRSYNSRSSSRSDNSKTSTKSSTRSTASSSNGRSYSGSSGRTRAN